MKPHGSAASSRPRVLVLLASHDGSEWITEQIESILTQEGVDVRIAVRDDCSTDETRARVEPFLASGRVTLSCGDTPTGSAAQNYFALFRENAASGFEYVALADQDDVWNADKLSRACQQLTAGSHAGYSSATLAVWQNGKSALLTQPDRATRGDFLFGGIGQGCTFVLTAGFYARAREFLAANSSLTGAIHYHDWALYALARTWDLRWIFDATPTARYRQHGRNDTGARSSLAGMRKRIELIRSGWYSRQLAAIAELCAAAGSSNDTVRAWRAILSSPRRWSRRLRIAGFCVSGGRRGLTDNAVLLFAALSGWI